MSRSPSMRHNARATRTFNTEQRGQGSRREILLWGGGLAALTVAAYARMLWADFIWDDDAYVTHNAVLQMADGLRRIWFDLGATIQYYPLVFSSFWVEVRLWGLNPAGYHAVNVILHVLAVLLLWRLLRRLGVPGAWLAAAIFAVHPVHVESVAWITERKNVLSLVFYLGAAMAYSRFAGIGSAPVNGGSIAQPSNSTLRFYLLSLTLFALALLSKTATVAFPVAMLLVIWWKRGGVRLRDISPLVPFFAAAISAGLVTSFVEAHHVGAAELDWSLSLPQRCLLAGRSLCFYLSKLAWPSNLTFIYDRREIDPSDWRAYIWPGVMIALLLVPWMLRARIGRGPFTAAAFFTVSLLPALGFVPFFFMHYSFVADHFQYLASIGPIALFAGFATTFCRRRMTGAVSAGAATIGGVLVLVLMALTVRRCGVFQNKETLWNDVLNKSPTAGWMAHQNLGVYYFELGRFEESARHYSESIRLKPQFPEVHQNLAVALHQLGRLDEAVAEEREAIRLKPDYRDAASNLGVFLEEMGRVDDAIGAYRKAIQIDGNFAVAHFHMARLLARQGRSDEAIREYEEVLRIEPGDAEAAGELAELRRRAPGNP